jgi:hypothetical protein
VCQSRPLPVMYNETLLLCANIMVRVSVRGHNIRIMSWRLMCSNAAPVDCSRFSQENI